jgi:hypothetical protein
VAINTKTIASWILALVVALPFQALAGTDYSLCTELLASKQGPESRDFFIPHLKFLPEGGMLLERKEGWRVLGAARIPTSLSEKVPGTDRYRVLDYVFNDVPGQTELRRPDGSRYSLYNFARVRFHFDEQGRLERVSEVIHHDAAYETGRQVRSALSLEREAALKDRRKPQGPIDLSARIEQDVRRKEWSFRYVGDRCVPDSQTVQLLDHWDEPRKGDGAKARPAASTSWCGPLESFFRENPSMLECGAELMIEAGNGDARPAASPAQCSNPIFRQRLSALLPGAYVEENTFDVATTAVRARKRWCENPAVSKSLSLLGPRRRAASAPPVRVEGPTEEFAATVQGD